MTSTDIYDSFLFTSKCCHAFNTYSGTSIICSECGNTIGQLPKGQLLAISVKFNANNTDNISGDIIAEYRHKAKRFADDTTYELCSMQCPKCKSLSRYTRDPQNNLLFICSNTNCRNVFDQNNDTFDK